MLIARIIYPITTLGPGNRLVIWTVGCSKHCCNCANPELFSFDSSKEISVKTLSGKINYIVENYNVDGITITGGDPLEQRKELFELLTLIKPNVQDLLVYTGYTLTELSRMLTEEELKFLKEHVPVLIDGPYVEELNDNKVSLRGSVNQNIHYFDVSLKSKYEQYLKKGRSVQNVYNDDMVISVGIHNIEEKENGRAEKNI